jgi:hypothetical protein
MDLSITLLVLGLLADFSSSQDIMGCGGFIKSEVDINFSVIEVKLYTKQGSLKYQTDCAPNNGYYMLPVYDKGDYILKVEPPPGWTFEPQTVELSIDGKTDRCSLGEDINFVFTGFGVVGKVVSRGQSSGPEGVSLVLKKADAEEQLIQQTVTTAGGKFVFQKVLPGDYVIEASRQPWLFDVSRISVRVDRETGNAGSALTVSGYDVQGRVFSDQEPVNGVHFVLFTRRDLPVPVVVGCDSSIPKDMPTLDGHTFICHITSDTDGLFRFPSVPTGQYILVPFYKGEYIKFDVVPNQLSLTVGHTSVVVQEPFHVAGFSVSGRVRTGPQGRGVVGANVIIDGRLQAVTSEGGLYHLDSMKSGTYHVSVEAERMSFEVTNVKVTPNTPQLPDIVASRFDVCGQIEMEPLVVQSRVVNVVGPSAELTQKTVVLPDGTFCMPCKPGTYQLSVELSESDVKAGLKLLPISKEVTVVDEPVDGIKFTQYRATISGLIHCLEPSCGSLQLTLQSISRADDQRTIQTVEDGQNVKFAFSDVVPGKYRVSVINEQWCWKAKSQDIEVIDKDLMAVDFTQTGFILLASLSHSITLNFTHESEPDTVGSFSLTKGVNKFCLARPGIYQLTPVSCHQFEENVYLYDTSSPSPLSLIAVRHLVEGVITTPQPQTDITVTVRSGDVETVIGPLTTTIGGIAEADSPVAEVTTPPATPITYKFSYWGRSGEKLTISAASSLLLFYPSNVEVTVIADRCMGIAATLEGRPGVFINGEILPPLADVLITVTTKDEAVTKVAEVLTDDAGHYRVGPLDSLRQYSVSAVKEGFVFTVMDDKPFGYFQSFKLGKIHVKVTDRSSLLSGVLLSLSGGSNYRRNYITQDNGIIDFTSLSPGEYYLRVMMKEYQFEPASQMVRVGEGDMVELEIIGKRVEYSCYGFVLSLNGEPEPGVSVEAVSSGESQSKCRTVHEESKTEVDGSFRLRGLQPGCEYVIRLKSGDTNQHIERAMPRSKLVQMANDDVTGVNIIAFRRISQMDITGNVISNASADYISTLKVYLYKESTQDSPVHSVALGPTSFFYLPSVALNNQTYILKLTSSLSRSTYDYTLPEVQFTANVPHKHFTFKFEPQRKIVEQELTHTSFTVLPLTLIILFLAYNYQKLIPWLREYASSLQAMLLSRASSQPTMPYRQSTPPSSDVTQSTDLLATDVAKRKKAKKI